MKQCLLNKDWKAAAEVMAYSNYDQETADLFYQHAPEPTACPDCGQPIPWELNDQWNFFQYGCKSCNFNAIMAEKSSRVVQIMRSHGVPGRYLEASLTDFPASFRKMDLTRGHFLRGGCGIGKTHLLVSMFRQTVLDMKPEAIVSSERFKKRHPVYSELDHTDYPQFISAPELLMQIKSTFGQRDSSTEQDHIEKWAAPPILFLDDLGAEYSTEWATSTMFLLIDRRYTASKVTHISSNLTLDQLAQKMSDRIVSRISEMCKVVEMAGADRRMKKPNLACVV